MFLISAASSVSSDQARVSSILLMGFVWGLRRKSSWPTPTITGSRCSRRTAPTDISSALLGRRRVSSGTRGQFGVLLCSQSYVELQQESCRHEEQRKVCCLWPREREEQNADILQARTLRQVRKLSLPTNQNFSFLFIFQENSYSLHWHRCWVGHHEGRKYRSDKPHRQHWLIIKFDLPSCCWLCDPHHLRHPGARRAAALVWLCGLHEGAQWYRCGRYRLLCLWFQGLCSHTPLLLGIIWLF